MGNMAGQIVSAVIGAGTSLYAAKKAEDAQEKAQKKGIQAQKLAAQKAEDAQNAATKSQEERDAQRRQQLSDDSRPVGQGATIEFGTGEYEDAGSTNDFLTPIDVGNSSLGGTASGTGLGASSTGGLGFA